MQIISDKTMGCVDLRGEKNLLAWIQDWLRGMPSSGKGTLIVTCYEKCLGNNQDQVMSGVKNSLITQEG